MSARTLIFVLRALQNQLQIQILHKILIYFKKKIIKNASFFAILQHFSVPVLVACTLSNAWNPLCVVQIGRRTYPPRAISHFFNISCEIPPYGHFTPLLDFTFEHRGVKYHPRYHPYGISLLSIGRVKFLVYRKREVKCPGAPRGVCTTPNLNQTLHISENFV